jgi:hypothetical protein
VNAMRRSHRSGRPPSNDELDYLLSGGRLGGSQHEAIFGAVAGSVRGRHPRFAAMRGHGGMRMAAAAIALVSAAAAFVLWARGSNERDHFQSKGDTPAIALDAACLHATLSACPRKSILAFSARGARTGMLVTAYLQPEEPGQRVWLLSNEPVTAEIVDNEGLLSHGAQIPDDQVAGTYRLQVLVTRRPLSREKAVDPEPDNLVAKALFAAKVVP